MSSVKKRCHVLIAEDEPALQKLVAAALRRRQLIVEAAADGAQAIEFMKHHDPVPVLLLDLMMPTLSGWDVIDWLAEHRDHRPKSVVVITATDRSILGQLDPSVVNAIIFKPFDVFVLGAYIRAACELTITDRRHTRIVGGY